MSDQTIGIVIPGHDHRLAGTDVKEGQAVAKELWSHSREERMGDWVGHSPEALQDPRRWPFTSKRYGEVCGEN